MRGRSGQETSVIPSSCENTNSATAMKYDLSLLPRELTSYPGLPKLLWDILTSQDFQVPKDLIMELNKNGVGRWLSG